MVALKSWDPWLSDFLTFGEISREIANIQRSTSQKRQTADPSNRGRHHNHHPPGMELEGLIPPPSPIAIPNFCSRMDGLSHLNLEIYFWDYHITPVSYSTAFEV